MGGKLRGLRRVDGRALTDLAGGALWALPVIVATIPIAALLTAIFPVEPVSPLPPAGEPLGLLANLVAGAIIAPVGEEILFRGFATTAWAQDLGPRRALVRGAIFFAAVHVLTVAATSVVSVLVMVWTETGAPPPIFTRPTWIGRVVSRCPAVEK